MEEPSRKYYQRERNYGLAEPTIKDAKSLVSSIKKYSVDFPEKEFSNKLDEFLKNNPSNVLEKKLKDVIMWDILDKKGLLSTERIARILNHNSSWERPIEDAMSERKYICREVDGERVYFLNQQILQK